MTAQEELNLIDNAIKNILTAGQSFSIATGVSGGNSRSTSMAQLNQLYTRKAQLEQQLGLSGSPVRIGVGW